LREWVEELVDDTFLEGNNRIVSNGNVFRANLGATLCDIAQANAELLSKIFAPVAYIERMHLERCRVDQEPGADEFLMHAVIAQYVANILAEIAFDALTKFLHSFDVVRCNAPCAIFGVRLARLKFRYALLHLVVP